MVLKYNNHTAIVMHSYLDILFASLFVWKTNKQQSSHNLIFEFSYMLTHF